MDDKMVLRFRYKSAVNVCQTLNSTNTVEHLKDTVAAITGLKPANVNLLVGYPPKPLKNFDNPNLTLGDLNIKSGETVIVETVNATPYLKCNQDIGPHPYISNQGTLIKKVVPADNSCLFTSVYFIVSDGILDLSVTKNMRKIIADFVNADHDTYCDAFLGKSNKEYCNWILRDDSWGGAIELSILSRYYGLELVVIDAQTGRLDRFGEDQNYDCRGFLLYSGIHYDPLMWEELLPDVTNSNRQITTKTIFSVADNYALVMAQEIGEEAKKSHQYTNVHSFTLQCSVCNKGLTGQHEAVKHAKETGHSNFAEVS